MLVGLLVLLAVSMTAQMLSRRQLAPPPPIQRPTAMRPQAATTPPPADSSLYTTEATADVDALIDAATRTAPTPATTANPLIQTPTVSLTAVLNNVDNWIARSKSNAARDPQRRRVRGDQLYAAGLFSQAAQAYRAAAAFAPEDADNWAAIGEAHTLAEEYADAADAYARAVRIDPARVTTWYNLGVTDVRLGDVSGAIRAFRETLRLEPQHARAMHNLAALAEREGRLTEALTWWTQLAVISDAVRGEALAGAGRATVRLGDVRDGFDLLTEAFLIEPGNPAAATGIADVRMRPDFDTTIGGRWSAEPLLLWALAVDPYDDVAADLLLSIDDADNATD